jgi:acyl-CoA thioesterase-2
MRNGRELTDALVRRLDLVSTGPDAFEGLTGRGEGLVFGGMLLAQAVVAAGRTVAERLPHSLHAYFLRPTRHDAPLAWHVVRERDGFGFSTRRATATQRDRVVFAATIGFTTGQTSDELTHGDGAPPAVPPEAAPDWEDVRVEVLGDPAARRPNGPVEVRECDPDDAAPRPGRPARRRLWLRTRDRLPDEPMLHAALVAFMSDRGFLSTASRPHGLMWGARLGASLDHALWWHHPARADEWLLYVTESPAAVGGRALVLGALYDRSGRRVASVAQEGLIKVARRGGVPS